MDGAAGEAPLQGLVRWGRWRSFNRSRGSGPFPSPRDEGAGGTTDLNSKACTSWGAGPALFTSHAKPGY